MNSFIQAIPTKSDLISLSILRLDEIQPHIQGNKYYKLYYNIKFALKHHLDIVTFGGPHSNHIHATALACQKENIPCVGIIRGNNFKYKSTTLINAENLGMKLIYVDRETFKTLRDFDDALIVSHLNEQYGLNHKIHIVPEGGTNALGIKGAEKIMEEVHANFDVICCPVGTGGTVSGIINSLKGNKQIIGFSSLKDTYLTQEVSQFTQNKYDNWSINYDYHFGGYAKWNMHLVDFINKIKNQHQIPLCPIYTGKMLYGITDLIEKNSFQKGTKILAIHTGGLQGIEAFNRANKNLLN